ncbi:MAG: enoyl-CoA hydratase/isomerase family protein [Deltaproteobacteria bacterium]|nr:enoyl-CoA hydratase/isomerase family protein [Deltaproteobacteria bacterium]
MVLNRPEKNNALSVGLLVDLYHALTEWSADDTIRTLVITGSGGKAFCSGFDILSIPTNLTPQMEEFLKDHNPLDLVFSGIKKYPYPVIAMLNGHVFGAGFNLAVCCDIRVAADDIRMGMPPARLGLVYHPEGIKQFAEALGMARTREIFLTAKTYGPHEIREMGLVHHMVPRMELADKTYGLAEVIAANAPLSLKGTKRIINMLASAVSFRQEDLKEAETLINAAFNSEDLKEGQTAFVQKRKPEFKGR